MSLTVAEGASSSITPLESGTYIASCYMLVDLGEQYSEKFAKWSPQVLIGWEICGETIEINGEEHPRTLSKTFTASLGENSNLRKSLKSWRGRDFTADELKGFNLTNIIGAPCLLNVVSEEKNGKTYSNIMGIVPLSKGMGRPQKTLANVIYDIEQNDIADVDKLPDWIAKKVRESRTFQERASGDSGTATLHEIGDEDGELPF